MIPIYKEPLELGERALVAAQLAGLVAAAGMVLAAVPSGSALSAELVLVVPVVLGAVFARTSGQAWITALVGVVAAGSLSVHRLAEPADAFSQVAGQTVGVILLVVALRAVRDAAHRTSSALRRSEVTDQLTGVLNRVGFERLGGAAWGQAAGAGRQVAVLVLALDHFKTVNDLWGHGGGDDMLARLGAVLRECTRDGDLTVRLGGAEFAVLCPVEPGDGARVADRVRLDLAGRIAPG
ncbi:MAG TPA: GGDEF domain-containing protein, partial [Actinotalea sp.]|nr:GGDEF domain-containing protein [Actinotalea sp.]